MNNSDIYYEKCINHLMTTYPFFIYKLKKIQKIVRSVSDPNVLAITPQSPSSGSSASSAFIQSIVKPICAKCTGNKFYRLGNIVWSNSIEHRINEHQLYPSEYFIKIVLNTYIMNDYITNPPLQLNPEQIKSFYYIPLHYNKLLIIDALMKQGSYPRYENKNKYIYSEHSGVISIKNGVIDNIIVSAETNRMDIDDDTIYLPSNHPFMMGYEYLFHTHPNASNYAGRINEGIIYEFPSANDIFNFIKYHYNGKALVSLIASPEGTYVVRQIKPNKDKIPGTDFFYHLRKFTLKLEKMAMKKFSGISNISDPDTFHKNVSSDYHFIRKYNRFIEPINLFIEYYPRIKRNGEWCLQQINLPYFSS